jgi:hypothetical protein
MGFLRLDYITLKSKHFKNYHIQKEPDIQPGSLNLRYKISSKGQFVYLTIIFCV